MAEITDYETYAARIEECHGCHMWHAWDGRCKGCGCIMTVKARWLHARCPLNRWPPAAEAYPER